MLKKKISSYNDGVLGVYQANTTFTSFNAKTNGRTLNDYKFIMNLYFSEENKRQEDFLFAEAMGKKLTLKVKTPLVEGVENNHKIILGNIVYDIIKLDLDKKNKDLYLYLEEGCEIER